jgi:tetratricopeptide (TPR) repeat protein
VIAFALALSACATDGTTAKAEPEIPEAAIRSARAHHSQGIQALKDGRYAPAIRELRTAASLNPRDKWIRLALGEAYRLRGMPVEAESEFDAALEIDPTFQEARLTLSGLCIQLERYAEAIEHSQKLIDDPTYTAVWMALTNKGFAQLRLGQLVEARQSLELATEFNDRYWRAHLNLGILAAQLGQREEAIARFARVIALAAGTLGEAEANYRTGEIYVAMGDVDRAVRHLAAATQRNPDGQWGRLSADTLKRLP